MPTYVYECAKCGDEFEVWQPITDDPLKRHSGSCRGKLTKVIQPAGIVLKGSGFYKNDSRNGSKRSSTSSSSDTTSGESGGDSSSKASSSEPSKSPGSKSDSSSGNGTSPKKPAKASSSSPS